MLIVIFGIIGSTTLILIIWKFLFEIASSDIGAFTIVPCYLGALISISPIVILPLDITSSLLGYKNEQFFTLVKFFWKSAYFLLFVLCWIIFPILIEYELSGDFDHNKRLRTSFERNKHNWITQIIAVSVLSILYITVFNSKNSKFSISSMFIAAAHFWGMAQVTLLWGYGLVAIPTKIKSSLKLMDNSGIVEKLNSYYTILHNLEDLMAINRHEIERFNDKLKYLYSISKEERKKCTIGKMIKVINESLSMYIRTHEYSGKMFSLKSIDYKDFDGDISMEDLIVFNRELKLLVAEERRIYYLWESTLSNSWILEDLLAQDELHPGIDGENNPLIFSSVIVLPMKTFNDNFKSNNCKFTISNKSNKSPKNINMVNNESSTKKVIAKSAHLTQQLRHFVLKKVATPLNNHLSHVFYIISSITSIGIIIAEATMYFPNTNVSLYSHTIRVFLKIRSLNDSVKFILLYFICQLLLIYVYVCTYWGLFNFKIPKKYGIYFNHHTDGTCIVFFSQFLCKLSTALCFHYLSILKIEETEFGKFYGKQVQHLNIFGKDFNVFFFPIVVVLVYAINIFDLQGRLIRNSGIYHVFFEYYIFDGDVVGANIETESTEYEQISNGKRISEVQKIKRAMEFDKCKC
ncbi:signal peptide-containing protein [Cryptosporidium canis]|uniref:Signal peptide-containing protein n=1 Tax=Cryptosporidium canis TaxID=195482 RepID=A0A9D5DIB8_9CRYT|nr:signal peptide-containing protein [Cryptosporidium canis]